MRHIERIFLEFAAYLAEIAKGAAHADELSFGIEVFKPLQPFEVLRDVSGYRVLTFFGSTVTGEFLAQRHRAERKRVLRYHHPAVVIDHFDGAAADIHDKSFGHFHRIDDALINECGFLFLTQYL